MTDTTTESPAEPPGHAKTADDDLQRMGDAVGGRMSRWRTGSFGPASELPYRRRTSDWVRLVIALVLMVWMIAHQGHETPTERDLFEFFNQLPDALRSLFSLLYRFGALWALAIIAFAALFARRWRLARDLAIAGLLAWFIARLIGELVVDDASLNKSLHVITRFRDTPSFPVARLALIVAVIAAASPYLTRPVRRFSRVLILLLALAAMYLGTGLPDDIFAAVVLGWGIAALVHLGFGSPGGRPTRAQVGAALSELGVDARDVELDPAHGERGTWMTARDEGGALELRVLGRDEADAQYLAKAWRFIAYKDGGPTLHLTRLEDVEHEAYTVLLAERAGARVPSVVVAGKAGPSTAVLAARPVDGPRLAAIDAAVVTDAVLDDLWKQAASLNAARVAHGRLNANHVVITDDGPAIADFVDATAAATDDQRSVDVAELL
jgi:undecaprenyl-diphosphatase